VVWNFLIAICKASHTTHNAEHVVVGGIHVDSGAEVGAYSVVADSEEEGGVIDTRQVASA
jgi:hypothetical protein